MKLYTHVPSSGRRASTGSADGQTTWTVGGTEIGRHHAAGPAPKSATHRHTAMQQLTRHPALDTDRSNMQISRRKKKAWGERESKREKSTNTVQKCTGTQLKIWQQWQMSCLHVCFLMFWCVPIVPGTSSWAWFRLTMGWIKGNLLCGTCVNMCVKACVKAWSPGKIQLWRNLHNPCRPISTCVAVSLILRSQTTHYGAVTGGRDALPVLTPLAAMGVGGAARAVRKPETLLFRTVCKTVMAHNKPVSCNSYVLSGFLSLINSDQ